MSDFLTTLSSFRLTPIRLNLSALLGAHPVRLASGYLVNKEIGEGQGVVGGGPVWLRLRPIGPSHGLTRPSVTAMVSNYGHRVEFQ